MGSGLLPGLGPMLLSTLLLELGNFWGANCFKIDVSLFYLSNARAQVPFQVIDGGNLLKSFSDGDAYFQDRSYLLPKSRNGAIQVQSPSSPPLPISFVYPSLVVFRVLWSILSLIMPAQ